MVGYGERHSGHARLGAPAPRRRGYFAGEAPAFPGLRLLEVIVPLQRRQGEEVRDEKDRHGRLIFTEV